MESRPLSVSVLIPAFNEEGSIASTVAALQAQRGLCAEMEILVIDDGSKDRTAEIAAKLPGVRVITHAINQGYGSALKTGLRHAHHDYILIADADGTYPIEQMSSILEGAASWDMVVGARTGASVRVPWMRRPAKWILTRLAEYLSNQKIPDLNSGFRLFRKDVARRFLHLYPDGFSFTTTITLAMLTNHYRVRFVPIDYRKRVGRSTIQPLRDTTNFVILIIRICACFKPLNVFVPPALVMILVGIVKGAIDYTRLQHLGLLAVSLALTGVQMLFIALLADLIDQRMKM